MAEHTKPETCPKCGSIFVDWDRYHKVYRCLVKNCGWTSEYKNEYTKILSMSLSKNQLPKVQGITS